MSQLYDITIAGGGPVWPLLPLRPSMPSQSPNHRLLPSSVASLPSSTLKNKLLMCQAS